MLSVKTNRGYLPLEDINDFKIITEFGGTQTLSFDIPTKHKMIPYLMNQSILKYKDCEYVIDSVNQRRDISSYTSYVNMNDWKVRMHATWDSDGELFSSIILKILPTGWVLENVELVVNRIDLHLEGVTDYDILFQCRNLLNIAFEFHTAVKKIKILKPETYQSRGIYATDELNATDVEYKGDSKKFATRMYAYGKKTVLKDEDGKIIDTQYVTFKDLNNGKEYIDNNEYSDSIISVFWKDDSYTDPQALLNDTIVRLREMAKPSQAYQFKLLDLSRVNETYKMLSFFMYDKITLLTNNIREEHQVVEFTEYPYNQNKNEVVLSSVFKKITGTISKISNNINSIDTDLLRKENMINEIRQDVDTNSARIKNTYTKGETDIQIESVVQQASDVINISINKVEENVNGLDQRITNAEQQITPDQIINTVSSEYFKKEEIENSYSTKEEVSSEIKQLKDSVDITLKEMSGFNFLYNSSGWNATNFWYKEKSENSLLPVTGVEGIKDNETMDNTISQSAFFFEDGIMRQDVRLTTGNKYTLSCKMKRYIGECYLKIIQNDIVQTMFSFDEPYTDEEWHSCTTTFECLSSIVVLEIYGKKFWVGDIMLNDGDVEKTWSSNNDEIYTAGVKIDKNGIRISQSDTNTETIIDSSEFAVIDTKSDKKVVRVNGDTTVLNKAQIEDDLTVGNVKMVVRPNGIDFAVIEE